MAAIATVNSMIGKPRLKNCMNVISCPNFLLISDSTTLADAPMSVPLPPRQAPKDSAHPLLSEAGELFDYNEDYYA